MEYLLLILLFVMLFFAYILMERNILSSWVISTLVYTFVTALYIAFLGYFSRELSVTTVIVIISALTCWGLGELYAKACYIGRPLYRSFNVDNCGSNTCKPYYFSRVFVLGCTTLIVLFALYKYYLLYRYSIMAGNTEGILKAAEYARQYMLITHTTYFDGIIVSQLTVLFECVGYFFGYFFVFNLVICGQKDYRYLLPVLGYSLIIVSSTGRVDFVKLIAVVCVISFVLIKTKGGWQQGHNGKIIMIACISMVLIMVIFRLAGYLTGKSGTYGVAENLVRYTSGGLVGIDVYLGNPTRSSLIWGQECFREIYMKLRELGFDIPYYSAFPPFYSFGAFNSITSNGYTSLYAPLRDFGIAGMLVTRFFLGVFFGFYVERIMRRRIDELTPMRLIVMGLMYYPVGMCATGDVYSTILGMSFLYKLFYLYLLQRFMLPYGKRCRHIR